MGKILKFRKKKTLKQDLIITVVLTVGIALVLNAFLPDNFFSEFSEYTDATIKPSSEIDGDIKGYASATDGDTIKINGIKIRFHGIDAPELNQPCWKDNVQYQCGIVARNFLSSLINNQPVVCQTLSVDQYGRKIAKCYNYNNQDIGALMVSSGHATAYLYYSRDYKRQQQEAKKAKRGIWAGRFTEPYQYRKNN